MSGLEQVTTTEVPQAACRGAHPVAGQRHTMWSASLTHLTLCALFRFRGVDPSRTPDTVACSAGTLRVAASPVVGRKFREGHPLGESNIHPSDLTSSAIRG